MIVRSEQNRVRKCFHQQRRALMVGLGLVLELVLGLVGLGLVLGLVLGLAGFRVGWF